MKKNFKSAFLSLAVTAAQTIGFCMLCYLVLNMVDKKDNDKNSN